MLLLPLFVIKILFPKSMLRIKVTFSETIFSLLKLDENMWYAKCIIEYTYGFEINLS